MKKLAGFTLLEIILTLMVLAICFAAIMPWLLAALQGTLLVTTVQPAMEQNTLALERLRREIRQANCLTLQATTNTLAWTSRSDSQTKKIEYSQGILSWQPKADDQSYLLAQGVTDWKAVVKNDSAGSCLVTLSWTVAPPLSLDGPQTMAIPLQSEIMVRKEP